MKNMKLCIKTIKYGDNHCHYELYHKIEIKIFNKVLFTLHIPFYEPIVYQVGYGKYYDKYGYYTFSNQHQHLTYYDLKTVQEVKSFYESDNIKYKGYTLTHCGIHKLDETKIWFCPNVYERPYHNSRITKVFLIGGNLEKCKKEIDKIIEDKKSDKIIKKTFD